LVRRDDILIRSLSRADAYPHPVRDVQVLETHISWIVLAGEFAYKIKKPLRLGFLDFSTLERRRRFCDEELRLNRQWAPEIYLGVVPISGTAERPRIDGDGPAFEYAVKMARFPQQAILAAELEAGKLDGDDMLEIAEMLAAQHGHARRLIQSGEESVREVSAPMLDNFDYLVDGLESGTHAGLKNWTEASLRSLHGVLRQRAESGFVRECHGDLHLGNLVRLPTRIVAFDCIEFNAALRTIDVVSDVAFLVMDLVAHGRRDLAYAFLNRYFECTGDYDGVRVLALYVVYHCLIRAKVLAIRSAERTDDRDRRRDLDEMRHYCDVATDWMPEHVPALLITCGLSGSGKTWLSSRIMLSLPAIRARSDIERRRLAGIGESTRSGSAIGRGIYSTAMTSKTYERLLQAARSALQSGIDVILDGSFLRRSDRARARRVAEDCRAAFLIVEARASRDVLMERVTRRIREGRDASEADSDVLDHQFRIAEELDEAERTQALQFDTGSETDPAEFIDRVRAAIGRPLGSAKV
jgi:uncharacterized protein